MLNEVHAKITRKKLCPAEEDKKKEEKNEGKD